MLLVDLKRRMGIYRGERERKGEKDGWVMGERNGERAVSGEVGFFTGGRLKPVVLLSGWVSRVANKRPGPIVSCLMVSFCFRLLSPPRPWFLLFLDKYKREEKKLRIYTNISVIGFYENIGKISVDIFIKISIESNFSYFNYVDDEK